MSVNDLSVYFQPLKENNAGEEGSLGKSILGYFEGGEFPDWENVHIALIGVKESRGSAGNEGCENGADEVRRHFYRLKKNIHEPKIADLGNILPGETINDTYFALQDVIHQLLRKQVIPVVIGGSQDLTYANYLAYQNIEPTINIVSVDQAFDLGTAEDALNSATWVGKIILHQPNHLFNFSNVGYQSYYVDKKSIDLMAKLYFDTHRLGTMRDNIEEVEPVVRNADVLSFDVSSIRMSDAPGVEEPAPNGFYGEDACRITRYAGMGDKLSSIGFYGYNPVFDKRGQTAHLLAQMIWYFMDGFYSRKSDFPFRNTNDYQKYHVAFRDQANEIVFYKSLKSDRWWMEVPYPPDKRLKVQRHCLVPCSYRDYETALQEEVPDRWWQTFQKLG